MPSPVRRATFRFRNPINCQTVVKVSDERSYRMFPVVFSGTPSPLNPVYRISKKILIAISEALLKIFKLWSQIRIWRFEKDLSIFIKIHSVALCVSVDTDFSLLVKWSIENFSLCLSPPFFSLFSPFLSINTYAKRRTNVAARPQKWDATLES